MHSPSPPDRAGPGGTGARGPARGGAGSPGAGAALAPAHDATPEGCARAIMEALPAAMRVLRDEMRRPHLDWLSVPQFRALLYLNRHPGASVSGVAEHLGVTRPTASALIDRLVQRGLVSRSQDPGERRRAVLHLTPAGLEMLEESRRRTQARLAGRLSGLSGDDLAALARGLAVLQAVMRGVSP